MKWIVSGTLEQTGQPGKMNVEAESMREAFADAKMRGLIASEAIQAGDPAKQRVAQQAAARPRSNDAPTPPAAPGVKGGVEIPRHAITLVVAVLFVISGTGQILNSLFAATVAAREYQVIGGGACVAAGFVVLMLRQIAINTAAAK